MTISNACHFDRFGNRRVWSAWLLPMVIAGFVTGMFATRAEEHGFAEAAPSALPHEAETSKIATNVPPEINDALRRSRKGLATDNLLSREEAKKRDVIAEFKERLAAARKLRAQENFSDAEHLLEGILNAAAPEEFHRTALMEMALTLEADGQNMRAQQVFSQYVVKYAEDPSVPEVLLRQGLLYRKMGAITLSLAKFYAVMTAALKLDTEHIHYYQRLVLQAQTEIAETYYLQGNNKDAVEFLNRLLKLDDAELNKPQILYKLIRSELNLDDFENVVLQSKLFLRQYPDAPELPDVRFLYAKALQKVGRNAEAKQQVLALLKSQQAKAGSDPEQWVYWQQRAGNEIANLLYLEGDYVNALEIYRTLAGLSDSRKWQVPVWYQMGLIYERLDQPQKASDLYQRIVKDKEQDNAADKDPALKTVIEMAQWRLDFIHWEEASDNVVEQIGVPQSTPQPTAIPAS